MGFGVAVTMEMAKMAKNGPKVSLYSVLTHFVSLLVLNLPPGEYFSVQSAKITDEWSKQGQMRLFVLK